MGVGVCCGFVDSLGLATDLKAEWNGERAKQDDGRFRKWTDSTSNNQRDENLL